ncbi:MAG: BamA/TamA family outer membrane protein [Verrucomicrobia bacterium]|nr:BamA/TamA family outer membrane protein [Verrucomicrobiota bacterium]
MFKKLVLFILPMMAASCLEYAVHFIGLNDTEALKTVKSASFLTTLKKQAPTSLNALRFRAESDIPAMIKALHSHGYYDAKVEVRIQEEDEVQIFVMILPGPAYLLSAFQIDVFSEGHPFLCQSLGPQNLGIELGKPAVSVQILDAEEKALALLGECGHPLAKIESQEMVADYKTKTFAVHLKIDAGPLVKFGATVIEGSRHVKNKLFENKISWKEGDPYDTRLIDKTQQKLLDTGLFTSIVIAHDVEPGSNKELGMRIDATETKHRSINIGASYETFFGPGLTFGWENRNVAGLGRKLSLQGDVTAHSHTGTGIFFVPDFWKIDQDFVAQAQALQESILAYNEQSYSATTRVERRIGTKYRISMGVKSERLYVKKSVHNGTFTLLEFPLYFRWSSADHLLHPTRGATLEFKTIPSFNFSEDEWFYLYNSVVYRNYFTVIGKDFLVLAQQVMADSIVSTDLAAVPVPKRILGGSDEDLRGYRYHSVSPFHGRKPIGGRSGIFYTFETRFRISKTIGLVPFFDMGSVYLTPWPKLDEKWFKSAGLGFRYFSFLGPMRLDVAFPLDRRKFPHRHKHVDPIYRVLFSIGQTF